MAITGPAVDLKVIGLQEIGHFLVVGKLDSVRIADIVKERVQPPFRRRFGVQVAQRACSGIPRIL
ncbi:hypothetical protein D3C75_1201810 [compost metagenome]